jgi:hypothetical protein
VDNFIKTKGKPSAAMLAYLRDHLVSALEKYDQHHTRLDDLLCCLFS